METHGYYTCVAAGKNRLSRLDELNAGLARPLGWLQLGAPCTNYILYHKSATKTWVGGRSLSTSAKILGFFTPSPEEALLYVED